MVVSYICNKQKTSAKDCVQFKRTYLILNDIGEDINIHCGTLASSICLPTTVYTLRSLNNRDEIKFVSN